MNTSAAIPELTGHDDADLLIGDVARLSGLSIDTLRYYDRAGLLGAVHRDTGGRRIFDRDTLGLLDVLLRLRRPGMPVGDVRHFVDLVRSSRHRTCGTAGPTASSPSRGAGAARSAQGRPGSDRLEDRRLPGCRGRHRAATAPSGLAAAAGASTTAGHFDR